MPAQTRAELEPEIGHVLFIDTVGFSRLLIDEQRAVLETLNHAVRGAKRCQVSNAAGKLIRIPTGDGMALVFFDGPEAPVHCALEISRALREFPNVKVRMGVNSGPVSRVPDINEHSNIAGAGINVAQRVMSCGDSGHILLSKRSADDLNVYQHWKPHLHDLGECEVKGGDKLSLVNLYTEDSGNPAIPEKLLLADAQIDPKRRPSKASWLTIGIVLLFTSALGLFLLFPRVPKETPLGGPKDIVPQINAKSIAILPFENLSDDKQNIYFADGVLEEVLTDLAAIRDLKVISRTSVMEYRSGVARNVKEIAKQLGVAHILEGSVQRSEGRVRVNVQLIDARTDSHIWAEHYDREVADIFSLESELAQEIAASLKIELTPQEETAIQEKPTADVAAYELYVRAKTLMASSGYSRYEESLFKAVELLQDALERDPSFFIAYCELASAHDQIYLAGLDHSDSRLAQAATAIGKARKLRPQSRGELQLASAGHLYCGYMDYDGAIAELSTARKTLPNDPRVFELSGYIERRRGNWEDSLHDMKRAHDLDPRNFYILQQMALSYGYLRQYESELRVLDQALEIIPTDQGARLQRAAVELDWHANPRPLHLTLQKIFTEDPTAVASLAGQWIDLALCEHDAVAAKQALSAMGASGSHYVGLNFPRSWSEGIVARWAGNSDQARVAFTAARAEVAKTVHDLPNYAEPLSILGMIDANLGRKEEAISEGKRAIELLPVTRDSIKGALFLQSLAYIYAWTGEKNLACKQLAIVAKLPSDLSYGQLRLHPDWDCLRGEQGFAEIVASLAPR